MASPKPIPFFEHLSELRLRLVWCIVFLLAASLVGYYLNSQIISLLIKPYNQTLYYGSPTGGLTFILKISLFFGTIVSIPFWLYQVFGFLEPALPGKSTKLVYKIFLTSIFLALCGLLFSYYVVLPAALKFLSGFETSFIKPLITTNDYLNFATAYIVGFILIFQLPVIVFIIDKFHKIKLKAFGSSQKWVILISFILAAILTPTFDPLNQAILAVPLILLYELSFLSLWLIHRQS